MKWPDGSIYVGEFLDGKLHGKGKITYENGDYYDGQWADDMRNGKGTYYDAKKLLSKTSDWKDDECIDTENAGAPTPWTKMRSSQPTKPNYALKMPKRGKKHDFAADQAMLSGKPRKSVPMNGAQLAEKKLNKKNGVNTGLAVGAVGVAGAATTGGLVYAMNDWEEGEGPNQDVLEGQPEGLQEDSPFEGNVDDEGHADHTGAGHSDFSHVVGDHGNAVDV